jgi:hypothetical protein
MATMQKEPEVYGRNPGEWQVQVLLVLDILCREVGMSRSARHAVMGQARGPGGVPESWDDAYTAWERGRDRIVADLLMPDDIEGA